MLCLQPKMNRDFFELKPSSVELAGYSLSFYSEHSSDAGKLPS